MRCPVHLSIGQEATAVGVCQALRETDKVYSTHRSHAHYLAKGGNLKSMMSEIYGKADGCCGGRGGSMHLMDPSVGMEASIPIVGSAIPLAVGAALAFSMRQQDNVALTFLGDASVEEGVFHESLNFASLRKLPVVFVCENNFYSLFSSLPMRQPDRPIENLAQAHGIRTARGDGNEVTEVFRMATEAIEHARSGDGPTFLIFDTFRWLEHCGPNCDDHLGYRLEGELDTWKARCPVERCRKELVEMGALTDSDEEEIRKSILTEITGAFEHARSAPLPSIDTAAANVYA